MLGGIRNGPLCDTPSVPHHENAIAYGDQFLKL